ncbi:hypothetical protein E8E12_002428 [Didymella heteroderae]|uniref:Uncharacterized protein n=1 Tax=Didymella heteroderae TaxID=1769908 RepID=A0A9P4WR00_9PLEO|nr:hypothetical protein E8E12_002428 [Didymella heteroderae]
MNILTKLPAELIEAILMDAATEISPPVAFVNGESKYRCHQEIEDGHSRAVQAMQFRLVCRTFRDLSWKSFGHVIGHTLFDIRSLESFMNLKALSECGALAPWVRKLTIGCSVVWDMYPFHFYRLPMREHADLISKNCDELEHVWQAEKDWYSNMFLWRPECVKRFMMGSYGSLPGSFVPYDQSAASSFSMSFADCLRPLRNIEEVNYTWDYSIPPMRYRNILRQLQFTKRLSEETWETIGTYYNGGSGAHHGLTLLMAALKEANVVPSILDLSVEMDSQFAFLTFTAPSTLARVCQKVKTLRLRHAYSPLLSRDAFREQCQGKIQVISRSMFPALEALNVAEVPAIPWNIYRLNYNTPLPEPSDVPALQRLEVLNFENYIPQFLKTYGR